MTTDEIKKSLSSITSIPVSNLINKWVSLEDVCQRIGIVCDNHLSIDPKYKLFYFDTNSEMLLICKLTGVFNQISTLPKDQQQLALVVTKNDKLYINSIDQSAIQFDDIGKINSCISFDKIVALYFPNVNDKTLKKYLSDQI